MFLPFKGSLCVQVEFSYLPQLGSPQSAEIHSWFKNKHQYHKKALSIVLYKDVILKLLQIVEVT